MFVDNYAIPELLDVVFEYLQPHNLGHGAQRDLYNCSLVNRQFNNHAAALLYRQLSFEFYPWPADAMWHDREEIKQRKIFRAFHESPPLAANIKRLTISLNKRHYPIGDPIPTSEDFGQEIAHILHHARHLEYLELVNGDRQLLPSPQIALGKITHRALIAILRAVAALESNAKLSFTFHHNWDDGMGGKNFEGYQLIKSIPDHLAISELSLREIYPTKEHVLSLFSKLEHLEITVPPNHEIDFESVFDCVPLTTLCISCGFITSLPRTLQYLSVGTLMGEGVDPLCQASWKAISRLQRLLSLRFEFNVVRPWGGPPIPFKSINLRKLDARFGRQDGPPVINGLATHIFQPIFEHRSLETVAIHFSDNLSLDFLDSIFSASETIQSIEIDNCQGGRLYTLQNIVNAARKIPHLEYLKIPWPIPEPIKAGGRETRWDGIMETIPFQQCQ
jgi:hypothetical protein